LENNDPRANSKFSNMHYKGKSQYTVIHTNFHLILIFPPEPRDVSEHRKCQKLAGNPGKYSSQEGTKNDSRALPGYQWPQDPKTGVQQADPSLFAHQLSGIPQRSPLDKYLQTGCTSHKDIMYTSIFNVQVRKGHSSQNNQIDNI
jgi:hypothetical protein